MNRARTVPSAALIGFLAAGWAQAYHGPSAICAQVSDLEALAKQTSTSGRPPDPSATTAKLADLHQKLHASPDIDTLPSAKVAKNSFAKLVAEGPGNRDSAFAHRVGQVLLDHQEYFAAIKANFDCDAVIVRASSGKTGGAEPESAKARRPLEARTLEGDHQPLVFRVSLVFLFVVLLALLRRPKEKRRSIRHICHTPVVIQNQNRCTKTYIVDVSESGMRIEAPAEGAEKDEIDLFFCGRHHRGRIMWRNTYFAGVQLQKEISNRLVHAVVAATTTKAESAEIPSRALPCHTPDCHRSCRLHRPTALSSRQSAVKAMAQRRPEDAPAPDGTTGVGAEVSHGPAINKKTPAFRRGPSSLSKDGTDQRPVVTSMVLPSSRVT